MAKYLTDELELRSVADAIRAKGGTSESLAFPSGFVSAIEEIETDSSSASVSAKVVNFRDFDGTIVNAYSKEEFLALTTMPANPSHDGLTAQGWNWSFADAQAYVTKYGRLEVGQMYITDDGTTRVYIHLEDGRTSPMLGVCPYGTVYVDWGDGTAHDTLTGNSTSTVQWTNNHNYAAPGDYVIKLTVTGSMAFYGNNINDQYSGLLRYTSKGDGRNYSYRNAIKTVEIGSGVTSIGDSAFGYCYSLTSITIPSGVTIIGDSAFGYCYSLTSITIPSGVTDISNYVFNNCNSLTSIMIPSGVTDINSNAFNNCYGLTSITIPSGVTSIGSSAFSGCYSLTSITIPSSVTSIGSSAFNVCKSLAELHFKPSSPPTVSNSNAFASVPPDCIIYVPYSEDHSVLDAYKTAENLSTYASKMQEEPV